MLTSCACVAQMITAFQESDPENTGRLPTLLLRIIVQHVNETLTEADLDQMVREVDPHGTGQISYRDRDTLELVHAYID